MEVKLNFSDAAGSPIIFAVRESKQDSPSAHFARFCPGRESKAGIFSYADLSNFS
jgi:hypothetical protein